MKNEKVYLPNLRAVVTVFTIVLRDTAIADAKATVTCIGGSSMR